MYFISACLGGMKVSTGGKTVVNYAHSCGIFEMHFAVLQVSVTLLHSTPC